MTREEALAKADTKRKVRDMESPPLGGPMTDSPLFREAVEAYRMAQYCPTCEDEDIYQRSPEHCFDCVALGLEATLPFLRRLITEENAAKLEAEAKRKNDLDAAQGRCIPSNLSLAKECGWRDAVNFLRGTR